LYDQTAEVGTSKFAEIAASGKHSPLDMNER